MACKLDKLHADFLAAERELKSICAQWFQFGIDHGAYAKALARTSGNPGHEIFSAIKLAKERVAEAAAKASNARLSKTQSGREAA